MSRAGPGVKVEIDEGGLVVSIWRAEGQVRRRGLMLAIAVLLTVSALIAVTILLLGPSSTVAARILGTTASLAGYGVLALPGAMLLDAGRRGALAWGLFAVAALGAVLALVSIWTGDDAPETLVKSMITVMVAAIAVAQIAALVVRRRALDPPIVGLLFAASTVLAIVITGMFAVTIWAEVDSDFAGRLLGALIVLDALAVVLQPILARARAVGVEARLRITAAPGRPEEVTAEGRDLGAAVATAIRGVEARGGRVSAVEVLERGQNPPG